MQEKIYLSRPGVISAAGDSVEAVWSSAIHADNSCIKPIQITSGDVVPVARICDQPDVSPTKARFKTHCIRLEYAALRHIESAIEAAKARYRPERIAVCVGTCDNGSETSLWGHKHFFENGAFPNEYTLEMQSADYVATFIKEEYGITGPAVSFATACTSSASAIIRAASLIKSGLADACIAGGVDVASETVLLGFLALEAISPEPTNPFSKNRKGITLGDGAAFFVLSKEPLEKGQPKIVLKGYAESSDAHHLTAPDESGAGAVKAMTGALQAARLLPQDIGYLSLHGTGTVLNDKMESSATAQVFGADVLCSGTKSVTGHTLGASGALALSLCYKALVENYQKETWVLPAQAWDGIRDETLPALNFVCAEQNGAALQKSAKMLHNCMANSFGFGGANASLIVGLEAE